ncbi:sulfotransferase family protein [Fodinibius saliphilus]|uniref:sulfotransferase family protein n=1 Tax=Fodinibius saliphilus TaxID=1920650 RepID=UPI00110875B2|nr:sulfotransferase [Fodinibius saliphilus]
MGNKSLDLFIIGMPRSGTKLLRGLLNNHHDIFIPEVETLFIPKLLNKYGSQILSESQVIDVISEIKKSLFFFYYEKRHDFNFEALKVDRVNIKEFIDYLFNELASQRGISASILGDKSPNYINHIELLLQCYKSAKFVHIVRDPRDYVLSMEKAWGKNKYRAAYRWKKRVRNIIDLENEDRIMEIRYEDLISKPEETLEKVCLFLGVHFQSGLVQLENSIENLGSAKRASIKASNSKKYLDQLSPQEIQEIEEYCHPILKEYYKNENKNISEKIPGRLTEKYWEIYDGINLLNFNIKTHGLIRGIEKILKANKAK